MRTNYCLLSLLVFRVDSNLHRRTHSTALDSHPSTNPFTSHYPLPTSSPARINPPTQNTQPSASGSIAQTKEQKGHEIRLNPSTNQIRSVSHSQNLRRISSRVFNPVDSPD